MIRAVLTIAGKDIKQRIRDRSAVILAVVVPLGLAFILNLTIGGATEDEFSTDFAVNDDDGGAITDEFLAWLSNAEAEGFATVTHTEDEGQARDLVADSSVSAAFLIPAGFTDDVVSGSATALTVAGDVDQPIGAAVGVAIAEAFAAEVNAQRLAVATAIAAGADQTRIPQLVDAGATSSSVTLGAGEDVGRGFDFATYYATGIAVFFLFFTVQFGVLSLIDERESGTMPRLLAAPIRRQAILLGKLSAAFIVGMASTIVLWLATTVLMGADWGAWFGVLLLIVAGVTAAMALTAVVATFTKTAEQAASITAFVVVIFGMLGGTFFPVTRGAEALVAVSRITPHFWLMEGFQRLSAGEAIPNISLALGVILLFAAVLGAIGLARARRLVALQ